jgi:hypothetical protein
VVIKPVLSPGYVDRRSALGLLLARVFRDRAQKRVDHACASHLAGKNVVEGHKLAEVAIPKISQESLAEMVGTTGGRVNFFMNRFRKLGFIDYHTGDALQVHSSLLSIVLHDWLSAPKSEPPHNVSSSAICEVAK